MKKQLKKPDSKRIQELRKVRIMDTRSSKKDECTEPGKFYQACINPRGCGCSAC